jgi:hypothetical protein
MTSGCQIAFQADPSYEDPSGGPSLERPEITGLPTNPATDQRNASSSAVIARTPVLDLTGSAVVGRVFMFNADGQPAFAQSLDGRLNLGGFDVCELLISLNVVGHQARKTLYATLSGCPNMATATPSARRAQTAQKQHAWWEAGRHHLRVLVPRNLLPSKVRISVRQWQPLVSRP